MAQPYSARETLAIIIQTVLGGRAVFVAGAKQGLCLWVISEVHYVLTYSEGLRTLICAHIELH
jgi:hypothetical protein